MYPSLVGGFHPNLVLHTRGMLREIHLYFT